MIKPGQFSLCRSDNSWSCRVRPESYKAIKAGPNGSVGSKTAANCIGIRLCVPSYASQMPMVAGVLAPATFPFRLDDLRRSYPLGGSAFRNAQNERIHHPSQENEWLATLLPKTLASHSNHLLRSRASLNIIHFDRIKWLALPCWSSSASTLVA